jgi:hypothetical protein
MRSSLAKTTSARRTEVEIAHGAAAQSPFLRHRLIWLMNALLWGLNGNDGMVPASAESTPTSKKEADDVHHS